MQVENVKKITFAIVVMSFFVTMFGIGVVADMGPARTIATLILAVLFLSKGTTEPFETEGQAAATLAWITIFSLIVFAGSTVAYVWLNESQKAKKDQ